MKSPETVDVQYSPEYNALMQTAENAVAALEPQLAVDPPTRESLALAQALGVSVAYRAIDEKVNDAQHINAHAFTASTDLPYATYENMELALDEARQALWLQATNTVVKVHVRLGKTIDLDDPLNKVPLNEKLMNLIADSPGRGIDNIRFNRHAPLRFGVEEFEVRRFKERAISERSLVLRSMLSRLELPR